MAEEKIITTENRQGNNEFLITTMDLHITRLSNSYKYQTYKILMIYLLIKKGTNSLCEFLAYLLVKLIRHGGRLLFPSVATLKDH